MVRPDAVRTGKEKRGRLSSVFSTGKPLPELAEPAHTPRTLPHIDSTFSSFLLSFPLSPHLSSFPPSIHIAPYHLRSTCIFAKMSFPQPYKGYPDAKFFKLTLAAEGVLILSFNRPPVNAWHDPKWQELALILRRVRDDPDVASIVVAGEGRCFTAGLDLNAQSLTSIVSELPDAARRAIAFRSHIRDFQEAISWLEYVEKPVIAAVHVWRSDWRSIS